MCVLSFHPNQRLVWLAGRWFVKFNHLFILRIQSHQWWCGLSVVCILFIYFCHWKNRFSLFVVCLILVQNYYVWFRMTSAAVWNAYFGLKTKIIFKKFTINHKNYFLNFFLSAFKIRMRTRVYSNKLTDSNSRQINKKILQAHKFKIIRTFVFLSRPTIEQS